jgi:predicted esterase
MGDHDARVFMKRFLALLPAVLVASVAFAAPGLSAGGLSEFKVELPRELRQLAGRGQLSPVTHALVTVALPATFDMARDWPVMVISATSDPQYHSSRRLLRAYADTALAAGWILLAADPAEGVSGAQDDIALRYALNIAALAALASQWPGAEKASLAFGGFSGGAKNSGWLAAAFASQGRIIMGIYLAGINEDTVVSAARHFKVLDETYRRIPVFLQSGEQDEISTAAHHRTIYDALKRAGFRHVRVAYFPGPHVVDPGRLRTALDWFRDLAVQPAATR